MFDLEQFTADCRAALAADSSHILVREVVTRAVSDPSAVLKGLASRSAPKFRSSTMHLILRSLTSSGDP